MQGMQDHHADYLADPVVHGMQNEIDNTEILISIDDCMFFAKVRRKAEVRGRWLMESSYLSEEIEVCEVKNLPVAVVAMIHFIQKRFGETEGIV